MKKITLALSALLFTTSLTLADIPAPGPLNPEASAKKLIACDTLDELQELYNVGKDNIIMVKPTMDKLNHDLGKNKDGEDPCVVAYYGGAIVLDTQYLGDVKNDFGPTPMGFYAIHVKAPVPNGIDFYILWVDTKDAKTSTLVDPDKEI